MTTSLYSHVRDGIKTKYAADISGIHPTKREDDSILINTIYHLFGGNLAERLLKVMAVDIPGKVSPLRYHHYHHELDVVNNVLRYSGYFSIDDGGRHYYITSVTQFYDAILLLVAAMFHDYQHTQSKLPDIVNIAKAVNLFVPVNLEDMELLFIDTLDYDKNNDLLSGLLYECSPAYIDDIVDISCDIITLIEGTKYPYPVDESVPVLVSTLRMCDTGTSLLPGWFDSIYGGLFYEWAACGKIGKTDHGFAKFCDNQVKFVTSFPYNYELSNELRAQWEKAYQNAVDVKTLVDEWISLQ